jgi:NhaP-type Na+/H+ or K+/H+ antiporter
VQIVVLFVQLAVLGAAIGLGFALVTSFWLAFIFNDACLEIVLTFGAAYACYFVSEELCGASGLLAVVVMGFSMSVIGEQDCCLGESFVIWFLMSPPHQSSFGYGHPI